MTATPIGDAWALLARVSGGDLRLHFLSPEPNAPAAGLDAIGRKHLVFPVEPDLDVAEDRRSAGVQIVRHVLEDERGTRTFVDVVCAKAHLSELFMAVAKEMIEEFYVTRDRPDLACHRVLDRWRELLDRDTPGTSGAEKLAGVAGELIHLREVIRLNPNAIACWTGPAGSRHDFQSPAANLEVKATLTRHGRFFEIHSHDQLEPMPGIPLFLGAVKLERVPARGLSIPSLVKDIVELGVDRMRLETLIARAGLKPDDLTNEDIGFRLDEHLVYEVVSGFPAITSASFSEGGLPPGVMRVSYMIDLTSKPPYPLSEAEVQDLFRKIAGSA